MKFTDTDTVARREIYSKAGQGLKMTAKHYEKAVGDIRILSYGDEVGGFLLWV